MFCSIRRCERILHHKLVPESHLGDCRPPPGPQKMSSRRVAGWFLLCIQKSIWTDSKLDLFFPLHHSTQTDPSPAIWISGPKSGNELWNLFSGRDCSQSPTQTTTASVGPAPCCQLLSFSSCFPAHAHMPICTLDKQVNAAHRRAGVLLEENMHAYPLSNMPTCKMNTASGLLQGASSAKG